MKFTSFFDNLFNQPAKPNLKDLSSNLLEHEKNLKKLNKSLKTANANAQAAYDNHSDDETVRKLSTIKINLNIELMNLQQATENLSVEIEQRYAMLSKRRDELVASMASPADKAKHSKELAEVTSELKEFEEFKKSTEQAIARRAEEKRKAYEAEKLMFFDIVDSLVKDPQGLNDILLPLASPQSLKEGITFGDIAVAGKNAVAFLIGNRVVNLLDVPHLTTFYSKEFDKLNNIISGREPFNPLKPPFLIKLIQDPDFATSLEEKSAARLNAVIQTIAPTLVSVLLKEFGKTDAIEKELKEKESELKNLPRLIEELEKLVKSPAISAEDAKRIEELQQKIEPLQDLKDRAQIALVLKKLNDIGFNQEYIQKELVPIIADISNKIFHDPKNLVEVIKSLTKFIVSQDEQEKKEALQQILGKIDLHSLLNEAKLTTFLNEQGPMLGKAAVEIAGFSQVAKDALSKYQISDELLADTVASASRILASGLNNPKQLALVFDAVRPFIAGDEPKANLNAEQLEVQAQERAQRISRVVGLVPDLVLNDKFLSTVIQQMPQVLIRNKDNIINMASAVIPDVASKFTANVDPQFYKDSVSIGIDLANNLLAAVSPDSVKLIYSNAQVLLGENSGKDAALKKLTNEAIRLLDSDKIKTSISQDLPDFLARDTTQNALKQIATNVLSNDAELAEQLAKSGISQELVLNSLPVATKAAAGVLTTLPKVIDVYSRISDYQDFLRSPDFSQMPKEQQDAYRHEQQSSILASGAEVLGSKQFHDLLNNDLPTYLKANKSSLIDAGMKLIEHDKTIQALLTSNGISTELVKEGADVGIEFAAAALPLANKLATQSLAHPEELNKILMSIDEVIKAPKSEQEKKIMNTVSLILDFKNKHKEIGSLIDNELPTLLTEHSEKLGSVIDKFLSQTALGKKVNVKAEEIIKVASKHVPELTEIAGLYAKREYASMIPKVAKLIFKKDVMSLAGKMIFGSSKTSIHEKPLINKDQIKAAGAVLNSNIATVRQPSKATPESLNKPAHKKNKHKAVKPKLEQDDSWVQTVKEQSPKSGQKQKGQAK